MAFTVFLSQPVINVFQFYMSICHKSCLGGPGLSHWVTPEKKALLNNKILKVVVIVITTVGIQFYLKGMI